MCIWGKTPALHLGTTSACMTEHSAKSVSISSTLLWTHTKEQESVWSTYTECQRTSLLTLSEKTLHLLTCLIIVDEDIEAKALEAFEQLTGVSVCAVAYIHPCQDKFIRKTTFHATILRKNWIRYTVCMKHVCFTCLLIKVFVVDDDTLAHSLVAHLILECWWNNSVMAFRRVVLLPRLAILILLTNITDGNRWLRTALTKTKTYS